MRSAAGGRRTEAELRRAAAKMTHAREIFFAAVRMLDKALEDAEEGSPNDPWFWSRVTRALTSFAAGVGEGTWGTGESAVELGMSLDPARLMYEPKAYLATLDRLASRVAHAFANPEEVGKALIDWETWKDDPARAAGKL